MTFADIIKNNYSILPDDIKWWSKLAFHFTDIKNALNILETGTLYSRLKASEQNLMRNDNASRQVISITSPEVQRYVRFYFRPLTPTQYHNEGYKHPEVRLNGDIYSNIPVPIFFVFDLNKLLSEPLTKFSEFGESGSGAPMLSGADNFAALNFDKIYANGAMSNEPYEKKYRHAEILYPESYKIENSLISILCRNEFEQSMLLLMLKNRSEKLFNHFKPIIKVFEKNLFQKNGLYIDNIALGENIVSITFADNYARIKYINRNRGDNTNKLSPLKMLFTFEWKLHSEILFATSIESVIDYENLKSIIFDTIEIKKATTLAVTIECMGDLIGYTELPLCDII